MVTTPVASVRLTSASSLSADATRISDASGGRSSAAVRLVTSFDRRTSLHTEYVVRRTGAGARQLLNLISGDVPVKDAVAAFA